MGKLGKLDKLKINGYKSIKSLEIEFTNINILIGANGVGKSNFIGFFKFIKKILDKDLQFYTSEQGGANKILHFGKKITTEISFSLEFNPNGYNAILVPNDRDSFIFKKEETSITTSSKNYLPNNSGGLETVLNDKEYVNKYVMKYIKDWKVYHFHDTSKSSAMKQPCSINDYYSLAVDGGNLPAFLYFIKNHYENSYTKIIKTIQRVAPFFHDFILEPDVANNQIIRLRWKHKGSDLYFDSNDLSDGTIRFICLTTLLLQPNLPTMILLDEPELGLHPFALQILASLFRVASNKTQIIASTQSSTFADFFDIEDIIIADIKENATVFKRLNTNEYKEWFEEYSVGEMWQKNLIGGVPSYD